MALSPAKIFGRPTADRIWQGPAQRRAHAFLEDTIPGAIKLIIGPHACGKSIVLDRYLAGLEKKIYFRSRASWDNPSELLMALLQSVEIEPASDSDDDRREQFREYLNDERDAGNELLFVIDGAEQITSSVWLEFFRLSALECDDGYVPDLIIAGQPQAYEYLKSPMARGWNSCQFAVHRMPPLEPLDVCVYIKDRLNSVDLPEAVFSPAARVLMGKLSGGSFTTTNLLCQLSLVLARQRGTTFVDDELVQAAYAQLGKGQEQAAARELPTTRSVGGEGGLFVSQGGRLVTQCDLDKRLLLGRADHNQICLRAPEVSRHHATIVRVGTGYYIEDLDSVNGLTINGELSKRRKLNDRDVITIGPFQITFAAPAADASTGPRPPLRAVDDSTVWESAPEIA